ncbi:hypothetical protein PTKIN_Ptkin03bG0045500 [Pterospermum kingtungense]
MSSVVGKLYEEAKLFEEQLPEKKRQGEGFQIEEEPKRQKVGVDERDFKEADSDDDDDGDGFTSQTTVVEAGYGDDEPFVLETELERKCLQVPRCKKFKHDFMYPGLPLFELFKVKLVHNHKSRSCLSGKLCGAIEVKISRDNPVPISYYRVREKDADSITLTRDKNINLALTGPTPRPPIVDCCWFQLNLVFKFDNEDVFKDGEVYENSDLFDGGHGNHKSNSVPIPFRPGAINYDSCYIRRDWFGYYSHHDIKLFAYYGAFMGAWATVNVKILKKGVTSFYGFICARACVFYHRIRLLSIQSEQKRELPASGSVQLTRSVVGVPCYSSLVVAAVLYDQDHNQIVRGKTFFPVASHGQGHEWIDNGIEVTVKWCCSTDQ